MDDPSENAESARASAPEADGRPANRLAVFCDDARSSAVLALFGCAAFALVELPVAVWAYPGDVRLATFARLTVLDVALAAVLWVLLAALLTAVAAIVRLVRRPPADGRPGPPGLWEPRARAGSPGRLAPWMWTVVLCGGAYLGFSTVLTQKLIKHFKEPQLLSLLAAALQLCAFGVLAVIARVLASGLARLGRSLDGSLGAFNPVGRLAPALVAMVIMASVATAAVLRLMPQMKPLVPWRHLFACAVIAGGCFVGSRLLAWWRRLWPADRRRRRAQLLATVVAAVVFLGLAFLRIGADPEAKYLAIAASPPLSSLIDTVRFLNDFDRDGYGSLLGENDCGPLDASVHPGAPDVPDNGVDENCDGRDFSRASLASSRGRRMAVPEAFLRDWNFLLITVDTVRYDHTSFGGYVETAGRDTTPELARLVERSTSFTFAQAPSAGTMASIPAILTSRFFHSGIALDEDVKPRMPPRLRPQNTLLSEILKRKGYVTGAILTHEYFNDWGMKQGFDSYDNSLGAKPDPFRVTSHAVTDKALTWISKHNRKPWFLWAHYIDPHGRYVAHPGSKSFGTTEEDLYDGELHYTDKHLGRLFDNLSRMPGAERTVIMLTSDHGDAFNEHGFVNHGQALYRELLHVPLIVYVPSLPPRTVDGAVSPLDLVPTIADLAGIDVSDLSFEGESLVPQLFYGKDANDRVVFAETNWPRPLRAAITSEYKLVYNLQNNLYQLYDLEADDWEKTNVANKDKAGLEKMKRHLDDWLERVYYARDTATNQAAAQLDGTLLQQRPTPRLPLSGTSFDDGRIDVLGVDLEQPRARPGDKLDVSVYFHVKRRPSGRFRLQLECLIDDDANQAAAGARSKLRLTRDGLFPTDRWRAGEFVRDELACRLPQNWRGKTIVVGLRMIDESGGKVAQTGVAATFDPALAVVGRVPFDDAPATGTPVPGQPVSPPSSPPRGSAEATRESDR